MLLIDSGLQNASGAVPATITYTYLDSKVLFAIYRSQS
jgi:hypothetical protein